MLARRYKLPSSFFKEVRRAHVRPVQSITRESCYVRCYTSSLPHARIACIVQNAAFKNVVRRNAFRRKFYEEAQRVGLHRIPGYDLVFLMSRTASKLPSVQDMRKEISDIQKILT